MLNKMQSRNTGRCMRVIVTFRSMAENEEVNTPLRGVRTLLIHELLRKVVIDS
jgi:hypothetical protein